MMTDLYITFQKFPSKEEAIELAEILEKHNIDFELEDCSARFDPTFANNQIANEYRIKLQKKNFEKADELLSEISLKQLDKVESDYYLFSFSDEELIEIITKPDEWSMFDYLLAQKILKDRGKEINPEVAETIKRQKLQELAKPEDNQRGWVVGGYIFSLLGGLMGIFIGWHLHYHKKTLPNGDRFYAYSTGDREHGFKIFLIGIVSFILWTFLRIFY